MAKIFATIQVDVTVPDEAVKTDNQIFEACEQVDDLAFKLQGAVDALLPRGWSANVTS